MQRLYLVAALIVCGFVPHFAVIYTITDCMWFLVWRIHQFMRLCTYEVPFSVLAAWRDQVKKSLYKGGYGLPERQMAWQTVESILTKGY